MEERNSRWVDGWVGGWMNGEGKEEKMKISILNSRWINLGKMYLPSSMRNDTNVRVSGSL